MPSSRGGSRSAIASSARIISSQSEERLVDLEKTAEWKSFESAQSPGSWIAGLRASVGWTQAELGARLEGVSPARISDWEHDRRSVSKANAIKLARIFGVEAGRFL